MIGQVKYGEGGHQALGVRARGGSILESVQKEKHRSILESVQRGSLCRAWRLHVERVTGMTAGCPSSWDSRTDGDAAQ